MSRRVDLELSRRPPEFRVDAFVLGLFARQRGHSFVELGANNGINSHTRHFEAQLGWRGTCLEASPPNFAQLVANRPMCNNRHAVVWPFRTNVTFRAFPAISRLYGHSGIVSLRKPEEWARILGRPGWVAYTDTTVVAFIVELSPRARRLFVLMWRAPSSRYSSTSLSKVRVRVWTIESNKLTGDASTR